MAQVGPPKIPSIYAVILTFPAYRTVAQKTICQLFANFPGEPSELPTIRKLWPLRLIDWPQNLSCLFDRLLRSLIASGGDAYKRPCLSRRKCSSTKSVTWRFAP
jgi:hypothetical protein